MTPINTGLILQIHHSWDKSWDKSILLGRSLRIGFRTVMEPCGLIVPHYAPFRCALVMGWVQSATGSEPPSRNEAMFPVD